MREEELQQLGWDLVLVLHRSRLDGSAAKRLTRRLKDSRLQLKFVLIINTQV